MNSALLWTRELEKQKAQDYTLALELSMRYLWLTLRQNQTANTNRCYYYE